MHKNRLEAFSDGVIAIILTIMVLELKIPHEPTFAALLTQWPVFVSYVLSFGYIGIFWNNHHHLIYAARAVDGRIMWANLCLLFWLSLLPFATGWMGETNFAALPSALYGFILMMAALAYVLLQSCIICMDKGRSVLTQAIGGDWKGKLSPVLYLAGIGASFLLPGLAQILYVVVALFWIVPDRRIEKVVAE